MERFIKRIILWALQSSGSLTVQVEHKRSEDDFIIRALFLDKVIYEKIVGSKTWQRSYRKDLA